MEDIYRYVLSVHIVFVISWMAGLFYMVRLFIYHTEAQEKPEIEKTILSNQFELMEKKLWYIITTPAMILAVLAGILMVYIHPWLLTLPWFHYVKLSLVVLLLLYHFQCGRIMHQLKDGKFKFSSFQLRLWNELATVLMVAIVFTVILKNTMNWLYGLIGFILFGVLIMLVVKLYKRIREHSLK